MEKRVLAFDFGASSGRAIIGHFDGENIRLEEVHRFSNDPVSVNGTLYWDVLRLFFEIKQGLTKAKLAGGFDSIGIDTWGVDFGLLDEFGCLLENPIHYRDARTAGMIEEVFRTVPREELYSRTGIQFMELNTLFQLCALKKYRPHILDRLGIPSGILTPIVPSGTENGMLSAEICEELGLDPVKVVSVCGHDTQSAITAVPSQLDSFAFLSSGTWSLFGTEIPEPIVNNTSLSINITNEGGYGGMTGLLKNIIGLWLIQESRRQWKREGEDYSYADLERMALSAEPFKCFIDPDSPEFTPPGDIPGRVREFCRKTGQYGPQTVGEIMRCIYESLAMKYRSTFSMIKECTGRDYPDIHVIGGGTKDTLLCQMTANACNVPVKAGPIEATVLGNIAVQLLSSGDIPDIKKAREIISRSEALREYAPCDTDKWAGAYESFLKILK